MRGVSTVSPFSVAIANATPRPIRPSRAPHSPGRQRCRARQPAIACHQPGRRLHARHLPLCPGLEDRRAVLADGARIRGDAGGRDPAADQRDVRAVRARAGGRQLRHRPGPSVPLRGCPRGAGLCGNRARRPGPAGGDRQPPHPARAQARRAARPDAGPAATRGRGFLSAPLGDGRAGAGRRRRPAPPASPDQGIVPACRRGRGSGGLRGAVVPRRSAARYVRDAACADLAERTDQEPGDRRPSAPAGAPARGAAGSHAGLAGQRAGTCPAGESLLAPHGTGKRHRLRLRSACSRPSCARPRAAEA